MPNASIHSLGCRLNQAESARLAGQLSAAGYTLVPWGQPADLLVVNSCTVTAAAARKSRHTASQARRLCPHAFLVITGCDAQLEADRWRQEGIVDLVLPNPLKDRLPDVLPCPLPSLRPRATAPPVALEPRGPDNAPIPDDFREPAARALHGRTRAYLKIQNGCDFGCSYCIIPTVRGPPRSRAWDDTLQEARALVEQGFREVVLTGINVALYQSGGGTLTDLLQALAAIPGRFRLRLGALEPCPEIQRLIPFMANEPRVCRFLHLPMQYGEDSVLRAMGRRYSVAEYAELAQMACRAVPGLCLGTDIIVGFPGETAATFATCTATITALPFAYLHLFPFSVRPGTRAARLRPAVPQRVARERESALRAVAAAKARAFAAAHVGQRLEVLTEQQTPRGTWKGWSDNYLRVEIDSAGTPLAVNHVATVHIDRAADDGRNLYGHLVEA